MLSCVLVFATPWTVFRQAPLSMGFSRQEYWILLPFPPPGDLSDPGTEPVSPASQIRFVLMNKRSYFSDLLTKSKTGHYFLGNLLIFKYDEKTARILLLY